MPASTRAVRRRGAEVTVEEAYRRARLIGLQLLSATRQALGSLDRVERKTRRLFVPQGGTVYVPNYAFEVRELPADLAALDELLADPALLEPVVRSWEEAARGQGRDRRRQSQRPADRLSRPRRPGAPAPAGRSRSGAVAVGHNHRITAAAAALGCAKARRHYGGPRQRKVRHVARRSGT